MVHSAGARDRRRGTSLRAAGALAGIVYLAVLGCGAESGGHDGEGGRDGRDRSPSLATSAPIDASGPSPRAMDETYDIDALGVPQLLEAHYIDIDRVARVSRFRSGYGHDYSDEVESCRSMKHYFVPSDMDAAGQISIRAPVTGRVTRLREEWAGTQIEIASDRFPAFSFILFHVVLSKARALGDKLTAGEGLGMHVGPQTASDVAVLALTPSGRRLVSYFDVMPDSLFAVYRERGVASRGDLVIPRAERDASPLACHGEAFDGAGAIDNWIDLQRPSPITSAGSL